MATSGTTFTESFHVPGMPCLLYVAPSLCWQITTYMYWTVADTFKCCSHVVIVHCMTVHCSYRLKFSMWKLTWMIASFLIAIFLSFSSIMFNQHDQDHHTNPDRNAAQEMAQCECLFCYLSGKQKVSLIFGSRFSRSCSTCPSQRSK